MGDVDGGAGWPTFWSGVIAVTVWSLIVLELALRSRLPSLETADMKAKMETTV